MGYRLVTAAWHLSRLADRVRLTAFTLLAACDPATACDRVPTPQPLTVIASTITAAAVLATVRPLRGSHRLIAFTIRQSNTTQSHDAGRCGNVGAPWLPSLPDQKCGTGKPRSLRAGPVPGLP